MVSLCNSITLNNGVILPTRTVMAPMTTKGSTWEGIIQEEDFSFYSRRAEVASLLITGATAVSKLGEKFSYQMSAYDDSFLPGLSQLAKVMKKRGNKAIVQIYHGGANSRTSYEKYGEIEGVSAIDFYHLDFKVKKMSEERIWEIIEEFGKATERIINAGFDGVEIHGAYSHLIQQFFSRYSNKREDDWGGSAEKRMKFALEVIKKVQDTSKKMNRPDFIIGYRFTQEEIHQYEIGYTIEDSLQLIDRIADCNLDYIHATNPKYGNEIKETIRNRTTFIYTPGVLSLEDVEQGIQIGDMISTSRTAIIDPDFGFKVLNNQLEDILFEINSKEMAQSLSLPPKLVQWLLDPKGRNSVPKGMHYFS